MTAYDDLVLADSPLGYWPLDAASGTAHVDAAGGFGDGIAYGPTAGAPPLAPEGIHAVTFVSASSEHIGLPNAAPVSSYPFTVEGWIDTTGVSGVLLGWANNGSDDDYVTFGVDATGALSAVVRTSSYAAVTGPVVNDGDPHHIVGIFQGSGNVEMYVDGLFVSVSGTTASTLPTGVTRCSIGRLPRSASTAYFDGVIDAVAVYDYELTAERIAVHAEGPAYLWSDSDAPIRY